MEDPNNLMGSYSQDSNAHVNKDKRNVFQSIDSTTY